MVLGALGVLIACHDSLTAEQNACIVLMTFLLCGSMSIDADNMRDKTKYALAALMAVLTPLFAMTFIMNNWQVSMVRLWVMNYMLYFIIICIVLVLTWRFSISAAVCAVLAFLVFLLNTEVTAFRGTPVVPTDIFAVGTALSVSDNYTPVMTADIFISAQAMLLWIILGAKLSIRLKGNGFVKNALAVILIFAFIVNWNLGMSKYFDEHNPDTLHYDKYDTAVSNKKFGTLLTFWLNAKRMIIPKPEGYSKAKAEEVLKGISVPDAKESIKPNIVVVMDEAFSDLTGLYDIGTDKEVLPFFNSLGENTVRGNMFASVYGGNTCITEFEFLTGLTAGNFDAKTNAFTQSVTQNVHSLCNDLKNEGYTTTAIHPFWEKSWRRSEVYPLLGFDNTIFAENFGSGIERAGASMRSKPKFGDYEYVRGYLSDSESFKKVEEQFENKSPDERLFVFNVTIQNHGGYTYSGKDFEPEIKTEGVEDPSLEQYLTLANKTDSAIGELIEYFRSYDEPAAVVIFGDHQPNLSFERKLREPYQWLGKNGKYVVPFVIWTNYDIEEKSVDIISPVYLSSLVKEVCGIKKTGWDVFMDEMYQKYPVLTLGNIYDSSGTVKDAAAIDDDIYRKYKLLQYGILFDGVKP